MLAIALLGLGGFRQVGSLPNSFKIYVKFIFAPDTFPYTSKTMAHVAIKTDIFYASQPSLSLAFLCLFYGLKGSSAGHRYLN